MAEPEKTKSGLIVGIGFGAETDPVLVAQLLRGVVALANDRGYRSVSLVTTAESAYTDDTGAPYEQEITVEFVARETPRDGN